MIKRVLLYIVIGIILLLLSYFLFTNRELIIQTTRNIVEQVIGLDHEVVSIETEIDDGSNSDNNTNYSITESNGQKTYTNNYSLYSISVPSSWSIEENTDNKKVKIKSCS